ncbi:hypothetical protein F4859DRAFT_515841 [Xylaria cf. heliscus]|nr:hypothetical protein F4859DRAFT_515841 [Xylaria cf. heliscus]
MLQSFEDMSNNIMSDRAAQGQVTNNPSSRLLFGQQLFSPRRQVVQVSKQPKETDGKEVWRGGGTSTEWELDDEDELQALRSLLQLRVMKFGDVISKLEKAIMAQGWLAHKGIIYAMRQRFEEVRLGFRPKSPG